MKWAPVLLFLAVPAAVQEAETLDFAALVRIPADFSAVHAASGTAVLSSPRWGFLATAGEHAPAALEFTRIIRESWFRGWTGRGAFSIER
jgi:hypothetical protein